MAYTTIRTKTLTTANPLAVRKGFLVHFVEYAVSLGDQFTVAQLVKRFAGKKDQYGKPITSERVVRYAYWCEQKGIFAAVSA